ncbi:MAG TPA: hypothetical protein VGC41_15095, partial [Kofleriaceae bacterium]
WSRCRAKVGQRIQRVRSPDGMRILPAALGLSVVIHTVAIAWALHHDLEHPPVVTPPPAPIDVEVVQAQPVDSEPMAIALLEDHTVVNAHSTQPPQIVAAATRHSTSHEVAASTSQATGEPHPDAPHSKFMGMRAPEKDKPKPLNGPSEDFWRKFEENTKPLQPSSIEGQRIEDDVRSAEEHLGNARWVANATPDELAAERERVIATKQDREEHELKQKGAGYEAQHATFKGEVEPDGTAHIERKRSYDPTEIMMNRHNIDPYSANKLRFLDKTRDERYEIGKVYKKKQLSQSAVLAQKNLAYLWSHTSDAQERKDELFAMWDECAEPGPNISDDVVAGGTAARLQIIGFINARRTQGDLVFTEADVASYNAKKKSTATFDPYR